MSARARAREIMHVMAISSRDGDWSSTWDGTHVWREGFEYFLLAFKWREKFYATIEIER